MRVAIEVIVKGRMRPTPMVLTIPDTVKWYEIELQIQDYLSQTHQMGMCWMCHTFKKYDDLEVRGVSVTDKKEGGLRASEETMWVCEKCAKEYDEDEKAYSETDISDMPPECQEE